MHQILKWLASRFSQRSADVEPDEQHAPVGATTNENVKQENSASDQAPTIPVLTLIQESSFEVIESVGFDPYNSGSFDASKSWKSSSLK